MAVARSVLLTLAVACLAAAVHAADANQKSPMFVDWLSQRSSTKASKASYYEEVETEGACLKEVAWRNCRCFHTTGQLPELYCPHTYTETKLAPCKDDQYGSKDLLSEFVAVAVCSYSEEYFNQSIKYDKTDVEKIGIFTATCEMREDAESAGEPLCDGMSLDIQGDILRYPNVAWIGKPDGVDMDGSCDTRIDTPLRMGRSSSARKSAAAKNKATHPAKIQYAGEEGPKFYIGQGDIYSGTFWVTSRHKKVPYKTGQFQLVVSSNIPDDTALPHPPEGSYIARDNVIALEFYKSSGYY